VIEMILIGGGGHCRVAIDILNTLGIIPHGIFDDDKTSHGKKIMGIPVLGAINEIRDYVGKVEYAVITITDPVMRKLLSRRCYEMSLELSGFTHPSATISSFASISSKAQICSGCVINPTSLIKDHTIINTGAIIEHDTIIGEYSHVAPGARILGGVKIGNQCLIGASATVLPNISVGKGAIVGAGAVVIRNVEDHSKYVGIPAKKVKY
tara:strand:+ start:2140 stop:2766 length:627 start_codon:yes stop_codon:yes gene_type:complete